MTNTGAAEQIRADPAGAQQPMAARPATGMTVGELWRYPVKSMGGERLPEADLRPHGIAGDRVVHVVDEFGEIVTARTHAALLGLHARLGDDGQPRVEGLPWRHPATAARVRRAAGPGAQLVRYDGAERFDILPLLVATDGALAEFGEDRRRLRPNLVIANVEGLAERGWAGSVLRIGDALIVLHSLRDRCIVVTYDPDTLNQRLDILRDIRGRFAGKLALNAWVLRGGRIRVDDAVDLLDAGEVHLATPTSALGRMAR
jgi:hypothetical protein